MESFDTNQWYTISSASLGTGMPLRATVLYDKSVKGAVFFTKPGTGDAKTASFQWQIIPTTLNGESLFLLRCREPGPKAFMLATPDKSVPAVWATSEIPDNELYWRLTPWDDGTYALSNLFMGKDKNFQELSGQTGFKDVEDKPAQKYNIVKANSLINSAAWSTVALQYSTSIISQSTTSTSSSTRITSTSSATSATISDSFAESTPTQTSLSSPINASATSTATTIPPPPSNNNDASLAPGAVIAIAVSTSIVALIAIIGAIFFIYRRRRRQRQPLRIDAPEGYHGKAEYFPPGTELHYYAAKDVKQMPAIAGGYGQQQHEQHHQQQPHHQQGYPQEPPPVELPAETMTPELHGHHMNSHGYRPDKKYTHY